MNKTYGVKFLGGIIGLFQNPRVKLNSIIEQANLDGYEVVQLVNVGSSSMVMYLFKLLLSSFTLFIWGPSQEMTLITKKKDS